MRKKTREEFIEDAIAVHGDKYEYDLVEYDGNRVKVKVRCKVHGVFLIKPGHHVNCRQGCRACGYKKMSAKRSRTVDEVMRKARSVHGDKYEYIIDKNGDEPLSNKENITIVCKKHGAFTQNVDNHVNTGFGCYKCGKESMGNKQRQTLSGVLERFKKSHGDRYDYSKVEFSSCDEKVTVICKEHGEFDILTSHHYKGRGCPRCSSSIGESRIEVLLNGRVEYKKEHKFDDLGSGARKPRFDFYVPSLNTCIEYDGRQHYEMVVFGGSIEAARKSFERLKENDAIKNKYCEEKGIRLIRIPYTEFKNIEAILREAGI